MPKNNIPPCNTYINPFPNNPWFLYVCSWSLLKTLWEKEKWLIMSHSSFSHSVFLPYWRTFCHFFFNLKLSSAKALSLEESKICCVGKGWQQRKGSFLHHFKLSKPIPSLIQTEKIKSFTMRNWLNTRDSYLEGWFNITAYQAMYWNKSRIKAQLVSLEACSFNYHRWGSKAKPANFLASGSPFKNFYDISVQPRPVKTCGWTEEKMLVNAHNLHFYQVK